MPRKKKPRALVPEIVIQRLPDGTYEARMPGSTPVGRGKTFAEAAEHLKKLLR